MPTSHKPRGQPPPPAPAPPPERWKRIVEWAVFITAVASLPPAVYVGFQFGQNLGTEKYDLLKQEIASRDAATEKRIQELESKSANDNELIRQLKQKSEQYDAISTHPVIRLGVEQHPDISAIRVTVTNFSPFQIQLGYIYSIISIDHEDNPWHEVYKHYGILSKDEKLGIGHLGISNNIADIKSGKKSYTAAECLNYGILGGSTHFWQREFWFAYSPFSPTTAFTTITEEDRPVARLDEPCDLEKRGIR